MTLAIAGLIRREQWGARAFTGQTQMTAPRSRDRIMCHYTTGDELGREDTLAWARAIDHYHQSKGWVGIGYNLGFDQHGQILELRGADLVGAHCPDYNTRSFGVVYFGDDDPNYSDLTPAARQAFAQRIVPALEAHAERKLLIEGHRARRATACPGDEFTNWIAHGLPLDVPPSPRPEPTPEPAHTAPPWPGLYLRLVTRARGESERAWSRRWMRGEHVFRMQNRARARGWRIGVDGVFGPESERVTKAFQTEKTAWLIGHGNPQPVVDGTVGYHTWHALWEAPVT